MATAKVEEKTIFVAELSYGGLISATGIEEKNLQPLMMIEGPRQEYSPDRVRVFDSRNRYSSLITHAKYVTSKLRLSLLWTLKSNSKSHID